jgi:membrane-associated protease RseP (regulator of RpoE activity)
VVAKSFNIPVKSSGIAFFGPILGAFVEPDEKKLQKQRPIVQNAVFAAGPIANIVTGFIFMLILGYLILPGVGAITARDGIIVSPINGTPAFAAGLPNETKLAYANGYKIEGLSDFFNFSIGLKPNDTVVLKSLEGNEYSLTTVKNPQNASIGYMGLSYIKTIERPSQPGILHQLGFSVGNWLSELFLWLYFISINLGLVNLFPIFITDGARMLQTAVPKLVKDKKRSFAVWKIINQFCVLLILVLLLLPWIRKLFHF